MSLSVERLGGGAALLLRDEITATTLLLSCGGARGFAGSAGSAGDGSGRQSADDSGDDSASGGDDPATAHLPNHVRRFARELKDIAARTGTAALAAVLVPDYRVEACGMLPYLTEKSGAAGLPPVLMTHATRAIAPQFLAEYWYVRGSCITSIALTLTAWVD